MDELNAIVSEYVGLKEIVTYCDMKISELEAEKNKAMARLSEVINEYEKIQQRKVKELT